MNKLGCRKHLKNKLILVFFFLIMLIKLFKCNVYIYLVIAYSRKPLCKAIELNVPIHPLSFLSIPVSHVTNRGL